MAKRPIDSLVADIASDVPIDWDAVQKSAESDTLIRQFRIIAAVGAGRGRPEPVPGWTASRIVLHFAAALAGAKLVLLLLIVLPHVTTAHIGPLAFMAVAFGVAAGVLLAGSRRDERTFALGVLFLVLGATFVDGYLVRAGTSTPLGLVAASFATLSPESFLPFVLWSFVWSFPARPVAAPSRRFGAAGLMVSAALGFLLFSLNAFANVLTGHAALVDRVVAVLSRYPAGTAFWPLAILVAVPSFGHLFWKLRERPFEERNRAAFMMLAIVVALAPMLLAVVAASIVPALGRPPVSSWIGLITYSALASIIPSTAYAIVVRKVMNVHLVIRTAVQHSLARYAVWLLILGSVVYVGFALYAGRQRPLAELASEQAGLMILSALGLAGLMFRPQLLAAVDRWFERGTADHAEVMARLVARLGGQRNIRDLLGTLEDELMNALHARCVSSVVLNQDRSCLVSLDGRARPLPIGSPIAAMFRSTRQGVRLGGDDRMSRLLLPADREWLTRTQTDWVFPLIDASDALMGLVCLGEGRGPAYSRRDRTLISAMADQVALRMENLSLRNWPSEAGLPAAGVTPDWLNERAMQCPECLRVSPAGSSVCECGHPVEPAALPQVLNGKFRVERVLGSGGMSVVYLAVDMDLARRVAIKTMPAATPNLIARLQREARAMAAVEHPNVAKIHTAERWRDVPLLVVEYLEGGTLLDALRVGAMPAEEALDLGILLADALDRMHAAGLLHRDIKPSNIGYTADGVPKLLDLGLSAMIRQEEETSSAGSEPAVAAAASVAGTSIAWSPVATRLTQHLVGTPLYLSPEALRLEQPDATFDLWSLSMVLYEAIAGRHPFAGYPADEAMRRTLSVRIPDVRDFRPDCPPVVAAFLNDALSLSAERRPATAAQLRAGLQSIRLGFTAAPPNLPRRPLY